MENELGVEVGKRAMRVSVFRFPDSLALSWAGIPEINVAPKRLLRLNLLRSSAALLTAWEVRRDWLSSPFSPALDSLFGLGFSDSTTLECSVLISKIDRLAGWSLKFFSNSETSQITHQGLEWGVRVEMVPGSDTGYLGRSDAELTWSPFCQMPVHHQYASWGKFSSTHRCSISVQ